MRCYWHKLHRNKDRDPKNDREVLMTKCADKNCDRNSRDKLCALCKKFKGCTYAQRTCKVCDKSFDVELRNNWTKIELVEGWKCQSCTYSSIRTDHHCSTCTNRLYSITNKENKEFGTSICFKCPLFEMLGEFNFEELNKSDDFEEYCYQIFCGFNDLLESSIDKLNEYSEPKDRSKYNYLVLNDKYKEDFCFYEFILSIKYIGFGMNDRKYHDLHVYAGDSHGVYVYEFASDLNEPLAKWKEKGSILFMKSIIDDLEDKENFNIINGVGRLTDNKDYRILKVIGITVLYKAYLEANSSNLEIRTKKI